MDVLMPVPMMPLIMDGIAATQTLHRMWDMPLAELAAVTPKIRGLAVGGGNIAIDGEFMGRFPALEIVSSFGVGYDHVDANWAAAHDIIVTHTPDVLNEEVADTAMGLLLATVRELPRAERFLRAGKWPSGSFPLTATLRGRTMGIVGLGRIGKAIARRAAAFGLALAYHGRTQQADVAYDYYPTLKGLAKAVDILMVIMPGGAVTKNLINAEILEALGPTGILINVARGSVVDEPALIEALQQGKILSAGLDVFADEPRVPQALRDMDHIVLLPHVGSASHNTRNAMGQLVVDNLRAWDLAQPPLTPISAHTSGVDILSAAELVKPALPGFQLVQNAPAAPAAPVAAANSNTQLAGRYTVLRDLKVASTCILVLSAGKPSAKGNFSASLETGCADKGMGIFNPVGWRMDG
eukprot:gene2508-2547_t